MKQNHVINYLITSLIYLTIFVTFFYLCEQLFNIKLFINIC